MVSSANEPWTHQLRHMPELNTYTDTEEKIFAAALTVFSRKGKDGARMQEIAEEAGMNKASLHYYFRSKDRLYEAVFSHVIQAYQACLQVTMDKKKPYSETLRSFINNLFDVHSRHPEISRLWIHENMNGAPVGGAMMREYLKSNPEAAATRFLERTRQAAESGEIVACDPFQVLITILGATVFYFLATPMLMAVNPGMFENRQDALARRKKHVFEILYYGMTTSNRLPDNGYAGAESPSIESENFPENQ